MKTPVLFLIFNRPEPTKKVFAAIRQARPERLFVAADGPRLLVEGEAERCNQTRKIIESVDWPCEVKTHFLNENLGCGKAVSKAITWFFEHVEEGIILEDDCVPNQDFFFYCISMLERYRHDMRVMQIAGTSYLGEALMHRDGHYLSKHGNQWGWATWRRAWALYDFEIKRFHDPDARLRMRKFMADDLIAEYLEGCYKALVEGRVDTWDYQWWFVCKLNGGLSVRTFRNLITNIGHDGAHSHQKVKTHDLESFAIDRSKINDCCDNRWVVRKADQTEFKFIGLYPKYPMLMKVSKKIRSLFWAVACTMLGSRAELLYNHLRLLKRSAKSTLLFMRKSPR